MQYLQATEFPTLKANFNCAKMDKIGNTVPDGIVESAQGLILIWYHGCHVHGTY